jgi:hypothetical protein
MVQLYSDADSTIHLVRQHGLLDSFLNLLLEILVRAKAAEGPGVDVAHPLIQQKVQPCSRVLPATCAVSGLYCPTATTL